jgi:lipid II isoglutaminyl synthase (glutamine-hydrolysing)
VIGGRVLLKLAPDAARSFADGRDVILVSGTNGKSTTTAMLVAAMRSTGPVGSNVDGANTPAGLVTTLAHGDADKYVLETDEGWLPWAIHNVGPRAAVLLNLTRDQLHRHPEVYGLAASWRHAIADVPVVVANVDDPAVVWVALAARAQVWVAAGQLWPEDSVVCPNCGRLLERDGQDWSCQCGLRRPEPTWVVEDAAIQYAGERVDVPGLLPGAANAANAAMALAAATVHGIEVDASVRAVASVHEVSGRYGEFIHGEQRVRLLLAKNPAGWQAALSLLADSTAPLVIAFNSDGVDGRDPSWLYDVSFTPLVGRTIVVYGRRASDMTVRLRMDGLTPRGQYTDLDGALNSLPPGSVDLVGNYTAFMEAWKELRRDT